MFKYETHMHTKPVSGCASATVEENLDFYKGLGYDGVFITNHFIDGNINMDRSEPYDKKINFYFSDYEKGVEYGKKIGIKVFFGFEMSYEGTDFLIYGLDKEWLLAHPEIEKMTTIQKLQTYMDAGALVIHAHPYREAFYIDHIRLYPRSIHGVETVNANRTELENKMADIYADNYGFFKTAGSDNHSAGKSQSKLAGMCSDTPLESVEDFMERVKNGKMEIFSETHDFYKDE